ncbi:MAG: flippase-like domain-containing protein [Deltaproteobacteria bacterium]|nr:flippase-like domain-containing protein [Deltaproteobacteria bacterium]
MRKCGSGEDAAHNARSGVRKQYGSPPQMVKKWLMPILKVAVSVLILYALFRNVDPRLLWRTFSSVSPWAIALAAVIYVIAQSLSTWRWATILREDVTITYKDLLSIYFIGMFFNNFLPTIVGGDIVKGYYLYRKTDRAEVAFASIFMDRYSGFAALMAITLVALLVGWRVVYSIGGAGLIAVFFLLIGGFTGASLFMWSEGLHSRLVSVLGKIRLFGFNEKIDRFYGVFMSYRGRRGVLARVFAFSLIIQAGVIAAYFILGAAMGMDVPAGYFFLFIPLATSASMIPFSLSGLGIREGVLVFLFTRAGASAEAALGMGLMWFFIAAVVSTYGAFEYMKAGGRKNSAAC